MTIGLRRAARLAATALILLHSGILSAASVAELTELARQSTFEVVLPKNEPTHVTYEKPLPLELLPFAERNDKFWSIGTAFAIAPDLFVSNGHVLLSGLGSSLGVPHLRDAAGKTYPVERVVKFSLHEDYIVFRAKGLSTPPPLPAARDVTVGARVYAVGNALGEGVVVRDGLLTSMTPEEQDGRWKWLRFSAAASPGNSGGPLLDESGRVVGVVTARSAGENLNYALPIALVLDGSDRAATIDVRSSFRLPVLRQQMVTEFKGGFALPVSWADFGRRLMEAEDGQYKANEKKLLALHAGDLPPVARSGRLLSELDRGSFLAFIAQQTDDSWGLTEPTDQEDTELDGATLRIGRFGSAASYLFFQDDVVADPQVHRDGKSFMDRLLKGLGLPRMIGSQAVRITSLGKPARETTHTDRFGRIWLLREWELGYADLQLVTFTLPTPDGYAGMLQLTPAVSRNATVAGLRLMADYVHVLYDGSALHWQNFLAQKDLLPPFLRGLRFGMDSATALSLPQLDVNIAAGLLPLTSESTLTVFPAYEARQGQLVARPGGFDVQVAPKEEGSWFGVRGQARPGTDAAADTQRRWRQMSARSTDFDGRPKAEQDRSAFWATGVIGDAEGDIQYEVTLTLKEKGLLPRQVSEKFDLLKSGLKFQAEGK